MDSLDMRTVPENIRTLLALASISLAGFALIGILGRTISRDLVALGTQTSTQPAGAIVVGSTQKQTPPSPVAGLSETFRNVKNLFVQTKPDGDERTGLWTALGGRRDAAFARIGETTERLGQWLRDRTAREVKP